MSLKGIYNHLFNPQWWMCEYHIPPYKIEHINSSGTNGCFPCGENYRAVDCTKDEALVYAKKELINRHLFDDYGDTLVFLVRRPTFFERLCKD